jgi:hypothetical protein
MTELAKQFFDIANVITAFSVIQTVALLLAFSKDIRLVGAFLRWRPYSSVLSKHAGNAYIIAVIGCGIAEFWLRCAAGQRGAFLGACVIAVALRCVAIKLASSVYLRVFVAICREENWLNMNRPEGREFQTPRVLHKLSKSEKWLRERAKNVDKTLFAAELEKVIEPKNFDEEDDLNK